MVLRWRLCHEEARPPSMGLDRYVCTASHLKDSIGCAKPCFGDSYKRDASSMPLLAVLP